MCFSPNIPAGLFFISSESDMSNRVNKKKGEGSPGLEKYLVGRDSLRVIDASRNRLKT